MAKAKTHAEQIAKREYDRVRKEMGDGWRHFSPMIREGLVYARIVSVTLSQDVGGSVSAQDVLDYQAEMIAAADALLTAEGTKWRL